MEVDQNLSTIKLEPLEIKSETEGEITAQSIAGGQEFQDTKGPISGAGVIKTEPIEIKNEPKDEPVVEFTAQDVVGGQNFKEESDNDLQTQGRPKEPKIEADNQSVFHALDDNEGLVMKYTLGESNSAESESVDLSTLCKSNKRKIIKKKEKPKIIKEPLSKESPNEFTILESNRVQCNYCAISKESVTKLRRHIRDSHREPTKLYKCPFCPFTSKRPVIKHIICKHKDYKDNIEYFVCHTCGKRFKLKDHLSRHVKTHRTVEELMQSNEIYKCDQCPTVFRYKNSWIRHTKCHLNKNDEPRRCTCRENLMYDIQSKTIIWECKCTGALIEEPSVQLKKDTFAQLKTLKCPECDFTTKFYVELNKHKYKCHNVKFPQNEDRDDKKYKCDKCDYRAYKPSILRDHSRIHLNPEEIEYFYCYHCNCKAKWKHNLIIHIKRHFEQEEVDFECHICDFKTKKRLIYLRHSGEHKKK